MPLRRLARDIDRAPRIDLKVGATLRDPAATPHDVVVLDLSASGFRLDTAVELPPGTPVTLGIGGTVRAARIVRSDARGAAASFLDPLTDAQLHASTLAGHDGPVLLQFPTAPREAAAAPPPAPATPPARLSPRARMAIIVGACILSWALVAMIVTLIA